MAGSSDNPILIPWGKLADGKLGFNIDDTSGVQLNTVLEVWSGTDPISETGPSAQNFPGRIVLMSTTGLVYIWDPTKGPGWRELGSLPATVGVTDPSTGLPPIAPPPLEGEIFWATDTEVAYVWDGSRWQPIGGRYAGYFKSIYYGPAETNGARVTFPLGLTLDEIDSLVGAEANVEAYIDGVRQSAAGGQYIVAGGNVRFFTPPPAGTTVYCRTLVSNIIAPTADVEAYYYDQYTTPYDIDGVRTQFELGSSGVNREGTQVYVNGVLQVGPADPVQPPVVADYDLISQDTTVTNLAVDGTGTLITVTTTAAHNANIGAQVVIDGVDTEPLFNATYQVQSIAGPNDYVVDNPNSIPALTVAAVGPNPGMFYTPPFLNDILEIPSVASGDPPLTAVDKINVRVVRNLISTESTGEVNDGINIGAGVPVYKDKLSFDLRFRSILAGANIAVVDTGNEVLISASAGTSFEDRNGINMSYHLVTTESYVGVLSVFPAVVIDLSNIADVIDAGRRIVIKDETGGAAANPITIIDPASGGRTFDGQPSYSINANYGSVTLVFSGANWFVTSGGAGGAASGVSSFNTRTGAVTPLAGDYTAIKITYANGGSGLVATDVQNAIDELAAGAAATIPAGMMAPFAGNAASVPGGWLLCDGKTIGDAGSGANLTSATYENLFNVVKTMTGDGNTGAEDWASLHQVKLPDLRGRVVAGPDNMGGAGAGQLQVSTEMPDVNTPGSKGGEDRHVLTEAEMPTHDHAIGGGSPLVTDPGAGTQQAGGALNWGTTPAITDPTGGSATHNNVQPTQLINWIVKV